MIIIRGIRIQRSQALSIALYLERIKEVMDEERFEPLESYMVFPKDIYDQAMEGWKLNTLLGVSADMIKELSSEPIPRKIQTGPFCTPKQMALLDSELAHRLKPGNSSKSTLVLFPADVTRALGTIYSRSQAASYGKRLPRSTLRQVMAAITRVNASDDFIRLAAEMLASGAPRAFRRQAHTFLVNHLCSPVGEVSARVFLEHPDRGASMTLNALAQAVENGDLKPLLAQVVLVGTWDRYCRENRLPVNNPDGAGSMVALAVMSLGTPELLRRHTPESIHSAFKCMHAKRWPVCINKVFRVFDPGEHPLATNLILQAAGNPDQARSPLWAEVKFRVRLRFRRYIEQRQR